jgi:hypothetical protein
MARAQKHQPAPAALARTRRLRHWTANNRPAVTTILGFTSPVFLAGIGVTCPGVQSMRVGGQVNPEGWERTMDRHARFGEHAIVTLYFTPHKLRTEQAFVITKMKCVQGGHRAPLPAHHRPLDLPRGRGGCGSEPHLTRQPHLVTCGLPRRSGPLLYLAAGHDRASFHTGGP